ncbi:hypothetical protein ACFE04_019038 [Oxalis oulophora]
MGDNLILYEKNCSFIKTHVPVSPIRACGTVKRRKEISFDNVIQRDKKLKLALNIKKILVNQPERVMELRELGKYKKALGLHKQRRIIGLLRKFPAVFQIVDDGGFSLRFKMTPEAERLYFDELKIKNEMEEILAVKLRKLLMMSLEKRILLEKIAYLGADLGLPQDFGDTICHRYPQYFKVVSTDRGPALELTHWDPELAISAAELTEQENQARELEEANLIIDRPRKFNINRVNLPKGLVCTKSEGRRISQFREIPYVSPYSDFSNLKSGSKEKEKHACGVVHEILSLTLEKRTIVNNITHFREEFRFSKHIRGMLIRHPDLFYVSLKGDQDSVFLREGYRGSTLIDKDRMLVTKGKLRALVNVPMFPRRGGALKKDDDPKEGSDAQEGLSDVDSYLNDSGLDDDNDDSDNDWGEDDLKEEDGSPPNLFEEREAVTIGLKKSAKKAGDRRKREEKEDGNALLHAMKFRGICRLKLPALVGELRTLISKHEFDIKTVTSNDLLNVVEMDIIKTSYSQKQNAAAEVLKVMRREGEPNLDCAKQDGTPLQWGSRQAMPCSYEWDKSTLFYIISLQQQQETASWRIAIDFFVA